MSRIYHQIQSHVIVLSHIEESGRDNNSQDTSRYQHLLHDSTGRNKIQNPLHRSAEHLAVSLSNYALASKMNIRWN